MSIFNNKVAYSKAPITEAIIDVRAVLPDDVDVATLRRGHDSEITAYPQATPLYLAHVHVEMPKAQAPTMQSTHGAHGWKSISADKLYVWQSRLDGFTLSRLAPYDQWKSFRAEAERLWDRYRIHARPAQVTRIAVRYVNRFDLPSQMGDLKEYLTTQPEVTTTMPHYALAGFFMQLQIPQPDLSAMLLLNEALVPPSGPETISVLLDIDLFIEKTLPTDSAQIWESIERLRHRKNEVFEGCITDATRERIR